MIKENALKYLGYLDNQVDSNTEILLNECLKELEQVTPKFMYQIYTLTHHPLTIKELNLTINYPDLIDLFDSCDRIVIIACTLGLQLDQQLRYYSKINLTKMTVMDALASSYIEIKCDSVYIIFGYLDNYYFLRRKYEESITCNIGFSAYDIYDIYNICNCLCSNR